MSKSLKYQIIKVVGYFPVVICLLLMFWSYYSYNFIYCLGLFNEIYKSKSYSALLITFYHILFILFLWSYLMVVFISPGNPKEAWSQLQQKTSSTNLALETEDNQRFLEAGGNDITPLQQARIIEPDHLMKLLRPEVELSNEDGQVFHMITVKQSGERRFCKKCNFYKPDRAHHCSVCGECVLKMDHHCPWINTCVGFNNQKYFILFILYADLFCLLISTSLIPGIIHIFTESIPISIQEVQLLFLMLVTSLFGVLLIFFVGFHLYLVWNNRTTIENLDKTFIKVDQHDEPTASKYLNIFHLGNWRNITEVFGDNPALWWIPVKSTKGNGIIYPLSAYAYNSLSTRMES